MITRNHKIIQHDIWKGEWLGVWMPHKVKIVSRELRDSCFTIKSKNEKSKYDIAFSTRASHVVTHRTTSRARTSLTSPSGREGVLLSLIWPKTSVISFISNISFIFPSSTGSCSIEMDIRTIPYHFISSQDSLTSYHRIRLVSSLESPWTILLLYFNINISLSRMFLIWCLSKITRNHKIIRHDISA